MQRVEELKMVRAELVATEKKIKMLEDKRGNLAREISALERDAENAEVRRREVLKRNALNEASDGDLREARGKSEAATKVLNEHQEMLTVVEGALHEATSGLKELKRREGSATLLAWAAVKDDLVEEIRKTGLIEKVRLAAAAAMMCGMNYQLFLHAVFPALPVNENQAAAGKLREKYKL